MMAVWNDSVLGYEKTTSLDDDKRNRCCNNFPHQKMETDASSSILESNFPLEGQQMNFY